MSGSARLPASPLAVAAAGAALLALAAVALGEVSHLFLPSPVAQTVAALPPAREALVVQLDHLARSAALTPSQQPVWRAFTDAMLRLEEATAAFETNRSASPAARENERARHTLLLGAALADLDEGLSPGQMSIVRRSIDTLAPGLICRGLGSV